jgi:hypothetical protein
MRVDHDAEPGAVVVQRPVPGRAQHDPDGAHGDRLDAQHQVLLVQWRERDVGEVRQCRLDALLKGRLAGDPAGHDPDGARGQRDDVEFSAVVGPAYCVDASDDELFAHDGGYPFTEPAVMPATK